MPATTPKLPRYSDDVSSNDPPIDAAGSGSDAEPVAEMEHLSSSECWGLMRTTPVGRLGLGGLDGDVEIFPVNFVVDHGSIVFRTAAGTKLDRVVATGQFTFEVDNSDLDAGVAWSVIAKGPCKVIDVHADLLDAMDLDVFPWHRGGKPTFVRLVPEQLTGRRFTIDPSAIRRSTTS